MSLRWTEEELEDYRRRQAKRRGPRGDGDAPPARKPTVEKPKARTPAGEIVPPSEDSEQITLFNWAARMVGKYPELKWLHHVPNGGSRGPAEAGRFKAMGVKAGVPDVFLDVPRGGFHGLRIEMKRRKGGRLEPEQREWLEHYNQIGYRAVVCYGWDQAREAIEDYLKGGPT